MKPRFLSRLLVVLAIAVAGPGIRLVSGADGPDGRVDEERRVTRIGRPLTFEPNLGQTDAYVDYLSRGEDYTLFLAGGEAVLVFGQRRAQAADARGGAGSSRSVSAMSPTTVRLRLVGANSQAQVEGVSLQAGVSHYFTGNDPSRWIQNVPHYGRVAYRDAYPGIDLEYYGTDGHLEFDFIVHPGARPSEIALDTAGAAAVNLDEAGGLVVSVPGGKVHLNAPTIYQRVGTDRQPVDGGYTLREDGRVGFRVGPYDRDLDLVIDPVLVYSTYLGGNGADQARAVAVDSAGNAYVTGMTYSADFPTLNAVDPTLDAPDKGDVFVTKFLPDGGLGYSTYLGSTPTPYYSSWIGGRDDAMAIAVAADGTAAITGWTEGKDFPTTDHAIQSTCKGWVSYGVLFCSRDIFVATLDPSGALVYSTYLATLATESAAAVAIDSSGLVYIGGSIAVCTSYSGSPSVETCLSEDEFPTTPNAYQLVRPLPPSTIFDSDAVVAVIDPGQVGAAGLVYATYLAGNVPALAGDDQAVDFVAGIGVDMSGNVYVTGSTKSANFPSKNAFQPAHGGGVNGLDGFVARLDPDQPVPDDTLVWSTFFGGYSAENANALATDADGNSYITGMTFSHFVDFPTTPGAYKERDDFTGSGGEAFVSKFDADGDLVYSTLFGGGGGTEWGLGIAVDGAGNAHIVGTTETTDTPVVNPIQASKGGGYSDAFVAKLSADGSALLFSTYLGGTGSEWGYGVAVDPLGNILVVGQTASSDDPGTPTNEGYPTLNALQPDAGGAGDAFVTKIDPYVFNDPPMVDPGGNQTVECACPDGTFVTLDGSNSSDPDGDLLTFTWKRAGYPPLDGATVTVQLPLGVHTLTLTVNDSVNLPVSASVQVTVEDTTPPVLTLTSTAVEVDATSPAGAAVDALAESGASATDICDPAPLLTHDGPATFPVGTTVVTITATDAAGNTDAQTFDVTVNPSNRPPVAVDTIADIIKNTGSIIALEASDPDDDPLTYQQDGPTPPPQALGFLFNYPVQGSVTYFSRPDFAGTDSFTFTVNDGLADSNVATVTIKSAGSLVALGDQTQLTVTDVPEPGGVHIVAPPSGGPTPAQISICGLPFPPILVPAGADFTLQCGSAILKVATGSITVPVDVNGTIVLVELDAGDFVTFTAQATITNNDVVAAEVLIDGVSVVIGPGETRTLNSPPNAEDDAAAVTAGTPETIDVLANDTDPDGHALVITAVTQGALGVVVNNGDDVTYTAGSVFGPLRTQIQALPLDHGQQNSLLAKVDAAERSFARGNRTAGRNQLGALINELQAMKRSGRLDPAVADSLISQVLAVQSGGLTDTFTYTVSDGHGGTDTAVVTVTVSL